MKLDAIGPICVTVTLDATDCLALSDALACHLRGDAPDRSLSAALRTAFLACAVLAAHDTLRDGAVPEGRMLADTRRVWAPLDGSVAGRRSTKVPEQVP